MKKEDAENAVKDRDFLILRAVMFEPDLSYRDIGRRFGLSGESVSRIYKREVRRARWWLWKMEDETFDYMDYACLTKNRRIYGPATWDNLVRAWKADKIKKYFYQKARQL